VDLVKLQLQVAQGEPLPFRQEDLRQRGHAIECRVYAEDPAAGFLPSPGTIVDLRTPQGPGVRDDSGAYPGWVVPIHYDPMISKLVAWGADRAEAVARLRRAVGEYRVLGIRTTLPFFDRVLQDPAFVAGDFDTGYIERLLASPDPRPELPWKVAVAAAAIRVYRERRASRFEDAGTGGGSAWRRAGWREALG